MADGQINARESGSVETVTELSAGTGELKSVKVRFNGSLYEVWPPDQGFEIEITNARIQPEATSNFDITITDTRVDTPPAPANFDITITDPRSISA